MFQLRMQLLQFCKSLPRYFFIIFIFYLSNNYQARSGVLQAFSPTFDLMGIVRDELNRVLPEDAHQLCTDRLFVCMQKISDWYELLIYFF